MQHRCEPNVTKAGRIGPPSRDNANCLLASYFAAATATLCFATHCSYWLRGMNLREAELMQ